MFQKHSLCIGPRKQAQVYLEPVAPPTAGHPRTPLRTDWLPFHIRQPRTGQETQMQRQTLLETTEQALHAWMMSHGCTPIWLKVSCKLLALRALASRPLPMQPPAQSSLQSCSNVRILHSPFPMKKHCGPQDPRARTSEPPGLRELWEHKCYIVVTNHFKVCAWSTVTACAVHTYQCASRQVLEYEVTLLLQCQSQSTQSSIHIALGLLNKEASAALRSSSQLRQITGNLGEGQNGSTQSQAQGEAQPGL